MIGVANSIEMFQTLIVKDSQGNLPIVQAPNGEGSLTFQTLIVKDSQGNPKKGFIMENEVLCFKPLSSKTVREIQMEEKEA